MASYSEDPVTDAAIRAVVAHEPKLRALRVLAAEARDEALGQYAENGRATAEDLNAYIGYQIQQAHGASTAGLMADDVNWAEVADEILKSPSAEGSQSDDPHSDWQRH
jgi:hypothetical protein